MYIAGRGAHTPSSLSLKCVGPIYRRNIKRGEEKCLRQGIKAVYVKVEHVVEWGTLKITPETRKHIFNRFQREKKGKTNSKIHPQSNRRNVSSKTCIEKKKKKLPRVLICQDFLVYPDISDTKEREKYRKGKKKA